MDGAPTKIAKRLSRVSPPCVLGLRVAGLWLNDAFLTCSWRFLRSDNLL